MDIKDALNIYETLAQETRLRVFRLLVKAGDGGLAAGEISQTLGTPHNTMSFHLGHLTRAGLVTAHKQGRSVIYVANYPVVHDLIRFMVRDCCNVEFARLHEEPHTGRSVIELREGGCCGLMEGDTETEGPAA